MNENNYQTDHDFSLYDLLEVLNANKYLYMIICSTLLIAYILFANNNEKFKTTLFISKNTVMNLELDYRIYESMIELGFDEDNVMILVERNIEDYDFFASTFEKFSKKYNENFSNEQISNYYNSLVINDRKKLNEKNNIIEVSIESNELKNNDNNFFKLFFIEYTDLIEDKIKNDFLVSLSRKIAESKLKKQYLIDEFILRIDIEIQKNLYDLELKKNKMQLNKVNLIKLYKSSIETAKDLNIIDPKIDYFISEKKTQLTNVLFAEKTNDNLLSDTTKIPTQFNSKYLLGQTALENEIKNLKAIDIDKIISDEIAIIKLKEKKKIFSNELSVDIDKLLKKYSFVASSDFFDNKISTNKINLFKYNSNRILITTEKYKRIYFAILLSIGVFLSSLLVYIKFEKTKRSSDNK